MNKLVLTAHPNPNGFTHKIASEFKKHCDENHDVKIIDLYDEQRKQDFLMLDETNRPMEDELRDLMQEMITWADEIIFVHPLWWFDWPAILKNWFDVNMTHGFAFQYVDNQKLLTGKKARIIITTGGPTRVSYTLGLCYYITRRRGRLGFVGIKLASYTVFGNMNKLRKPEDRKKMLEKVAKLAKNA